MFFFILSIIVFVTFIIKYYHRHCYTNFEEFNLYFTSLINDNENGSLSVVDMFHKCENNNKYHTKSNVDYLSIYKYIKEFVCQNNEYV